MKKNIVALTALITLGSLQPAFAADYSANDSHNDNSGLYLGIEGGWAGFNHKGTASVSVPFFPIATVNVDSHYNSVLIGLLAGYQFNDYFAVELKTSVIPYAHSSIDASIFGAEVEDASEFIYEANIKGILPLNNNFSLYGKGGIAALNLANHSIEVNIPKVKTANIPDEHAITPTLGAGINYAFTQHFSINAFYTCYLPKKTFSTTNVAGMGLSYKF